MRNAQELFKLVKEVQVMNELSRSMNNQIQTRQFQDSNEDSSDSCEVYEEEYQAATKMGTKDHGMSKEPSSGSFRNQTTEQNLPTQYMITQEMTTVNARDNLVIKLERMEEQFAQTLQRPEARIFVGSRKQTVAMPNQNNFYGNERQKFANTQALDISNIMMEDQEKNVKSVMTGQGVDL